jgi:hypothetical protein
MASRVGLVLGWIGVLVAASCVLPDTVAAQDTPEMLEAMRSHLPPIPAQVPLRDALPPELRTAIPEFRLEVHRWHDDPAQRFVTIHDRRIEESGVVDRDLWVRAIRPDGVVFQFREAFFFQPR